MFAGAEYVQCVFGRTEACQNMNTISRSSTRLACYCWQSVWQHRSFTDKSANSDHLSVLCCSCTNL